MRKARFSIRRTIARFSTGSRILGMGLCMALVIAGSSLAIGVAHARVDDEPGKRNEILPFLPLETATGVVFEDLNRNGTQDAGEPGVPDVSVSNGRDVVRTDDEGRYSLSVDHRTIVFISKPADYMVPVNDVQLPQFYYIHYPFGSAIPTQYPGIQPTGALPDSVDFPIYRTKEKKKFEALVFADPQTVSDEELDDFEEDVVAELIGDKSELGITVGDVVNDTLSLYPCHNQIVSTIGIPWWNLPGNHDLNYDVPSDDFSTETYKSVFGPTDYSFDVGQVHFVHMDNVDYLGAGAGYRGYINERQLAWLANDLEFVPEDKLILISTHIPLRTEAIGGMSLNTVNLDELFEVLEGRAHLYSISGHDTSNSWQMYMEPGEVRTPPTGVNEAVWTGEEAFHHTTLAEVRGSGWPTGPLDERGIQAADMQDGNPNGYYYISFDGNEYSTRFKGASLPEDYQMRITFEGGESGEVWIPSGPSGSHGISPSPLFGPSDWTAEQPPEVVVNVFDGGERHEVEVSFDDGEWTLMDYNPPVYGMTDGDPNGNIDPYIEELVQRYDGTSEQPADPEPSSHLWRVVLPPDLGPGTHTVKIRSTDPYGQKSRASERFEIVTG